MENFVDPQFARAVTFLYPGIRPDEDYILQDNGDGPVLVSWTFASPAPNASEIATALAGADKAAANAGIVAQIKALEDKQLRPTREVLLGNTASLAYLSILNDQITTLRTQLIP